MKLSDVILRGTRALQPAATAVPIGTLYYVTDETLLERSTGAAWESYSGSSGGSGTITKYTVGITIDGGGSAITTGIKGYRSIPITGTIVSARLLADQVGSVVIDIWKDLFANYPPTVADTITAAAKPTLSAAAASEDTTLTGWTTTVTTGDVLGFNVDSAATITWVVLELIILVP